MGSSKSHNRAQTSKESHVLNCWSVLMPMGRPFCPGSSQVTKPGLTIISRRRKGSQWSGIIRNNQEKKKFKKTPSAGKFMITVFWDIDGVILLDVMARGETINSDAYIINLQKLKQRYRRVRPNKNPGDMLIQLDNARFHTSL